VLDCISKSMQRTDTRVSAPGKNEFSDAARADQLVINEVGGHSNQCEILFSLPNDFVACGKRNEMIETLERNRITVVYELVDGLGEGGSERIRGFRHGGRAISALRCAEIIHVASRSKRQALFAYAVFLRVQPSSPRALVLDRDELDASQRRS